MKKLFILFFIFSTQVFAAELNLSGGESAIIQANVNTRVTCGGNSSDNNGSCRELAGGFRSLMQACEKSYNGGYCADKYWPEFKKANPGCYFAAISVCLESCEKSYNGGYCADKCK